MKKIKIGDVHLPLDQYVVSGTAILGIRDSGKTYAAKGIAEQLLDHGIPIIVFDAIGPWRHLRTAGDVKGGKGYPVVVAGGKEPDLPLTPESAPELVRAAINENISLVIDLYDKNLSKADWRKIVQSCFRVLLYENKGLRHIFLEESAEYVPQRVMDGQTYAEVEKLVRMGGNASLGITLINQRSQEVNKSVLDLCENLVLMRQRGAHAIDALTKWMDKLSPDLSRGIAKGMPDLKSGECWVFTGDTDVPKHTRTALIHSHHPDRRKPEGDKPRPAADATEFLKRMQIALPKLTAEKEANDPAKLRKRIAELERELNKPRASAPLDSALLANVRDGAIEAMRKVYFSGANGLREQLDRSIINYMDEVVSKFERDIENGAAALMSQPMTSAKPAAPIMQAAFFPALVRSDLRVVHDRHYSDEKVSPAVRKILDAIHSAYPVGLSFATAAMRAGISKKSSAYGGYLKAVNASSELDLSEDGKYRSKPEYGKGGAVGGNSIDTWAARLPPSFAKMLRAIQVNGPVQTSAIAEHAGISPTSSGLGTGLRELLSLGLIEKHSHGDYDLYRLAEGLRN